MKKLILIFVMAIAVAFSSCSGKKAEEMYETAQFEELQKNNVHAKQLYEEIIRKYPESEYAKKASDRLNALKEQE
jgi:outer membrane protein assembly factor BamD (BamD/ComL family)